MAAPIPTYSEKEPRLGIVIVFIKKTVTIMGKCKYTLRESQKPKHTIWADHVSTGTLSFEDAIKFACKGTDIEESAMRRDITEFMKTVQDFALMGYRVALGDQFLTVYPVISCSVTDKVDKQTGDIIEVCTADDLNIRQAKSRLGCSVSTKFSKRFDMEVSWVKTDKAGNPIDEEDITQDPEPGGDEGSGSGDDNGGNGGSDGGDENLEG